MSFFFRFPDPLWNLTSRKNFMVIRLVVSEILGCGTTPTDAIEPLKRADAINRYAPIKMFCPQNSSLWGQRKNGCDKKGQNMAHNKLCQVLN